MDARGFSKDPGGQVLRHVLHGQETPKPPGYQWSSKDPRDEIPYDGPKGEERVESCE